MYCVNLSNILYNKVYMNSSVAITGFISGLVTWFFMYVDSRIFDTPKTKTTYIKGILYSSFLSSTIVYFMGSPSIPKPINMTGGYGTALVQGINQEMFTGMPSF